MAIRKHNAKRNCSAKSPEAYQAAMGELYSRVTKLCTAGGLLKARADGTLPEQLDAYVDEHCMIDLCASVVAENANALLGVYESLQAAVGIEFRAPARQDA